MTQAITRAKQYLLVQAEHHFAETCHTMVFPRWAGFSVKKEEQASDVFARAVLADILLDVAEMDDEAGQFRVDWESIALREAQYVAQAKLRDRAGGWSYFPDLPELPPDADSLAAALRLFARIAPEYVSLCVEPVELVLQDAQPDGALNTWIIAPTDAPAQRRLMEKGVRRYWGRGTDIGVCARFYLALWANDPMRYGRAIRRGAQHIQGQQRPDGAWATTWYWGTAYGTGLCLRLLRDVGIGDLTQSKAVDFLQRSQREDGGWGTWQTVPLDTAHAIWAIAQVGAVQQATDIERAVHCLLDYQAEEGYWNPSPWIKMDVGRAQGTVRHTLTYQSTTLTTAFCLRSLLLARQISLQQEMRGAG